MATPLNLTSATSPRLLYWARYQSQALDYLHVETSTNGTDWITHDSLTGMQAAWKQFEVPLPQYAGQPTVYVRFRVETDASNDDDGWYVDDVFFDDGNPAVTIWAPAGGDLWAPGSSHDISWYYDNSYAPVAHTIAVSYSEDGVLYNTLVSDLLWYETSYPWTVPNIIDQQVYVRVQVFDLFGTFMTQATTPAFAIDSITGGEAGAGGVGGAAAPEAGAGGAGGSPGIGDAGAPGSVNGGMPSAEGGMPGELPLAGTAGIAGTPGMGGTAATSMGGSASQGGGKGTTPSPGAGGQNDSDGTGASAGDGGCGCRVGPRSSTGALAGLLALLGAVALGRRRNARRR